MESAPVSRENSDLNQPLITHPVLTPQPSEAKLHGSDGLLESILSDTDLPVLQRLRRATWLESRLLFRLAAPAVIVYLINYVMSMTTQIFSGHLGNLELAAASLGNSGVQIFAYGLMVAYSPVSFSLSLTRVFV